MAAQITLTIPDAVKAGLDACGAEFEMTGTERLKSWLQMALELPNGVTINLPRPQPPQMEQPLLELMVPAKD